MEDTKDKSTATPSLKQPSNKPINPEDVWIQGINLSTSTPAEITLFVRWKIGIYKEFGWKGDELGELYEMDFDQFRAEDFERCEHNTQVLLRNVLRSQGLYVKKGRGVKIARELAYAIHNETKWPDDDPEKPISSPSRTKTPIRQDSPYDQVRRLAAEQSQSQSQSQSRSQLCQLPEDQVIDALARMEISGHSRELMAIAKSYTNDNHKYSGEATDSFNYKFTIFVDHCERAKVPPDALLKAFPIMLTGIALEFYYINCQGKYHTINDLFAIFKNYFKGDKHKRNKLSEWNGINLRTAIQMKPDKPIAETFRAMVQQLQQIQRGLSGEMRTDNMLRQKIIASCEDHPACNVACFRPSLSLPGLINDIHASISSYEKTKRAESNSSTFFTDRRYHRPSSDNDRQRPNNTSLNNRQGQRYPQQYPHLHP
ncbi:hypothetical protein LPUS_03028 [Lasallia pustulata]|uniref:Uncharacterized protein n=1 Tax=Lasallia pustulata TaxID=136370 RepID=A0A1W5CTV3_9LECA|nr:hypothetical protein LPUS_03028 [Lasallia pustulata]